MSITIKGNGKQKKYVAKGSIPLGKGKYYHYQRIMYGATSKQDAIAMELNFKNSYKKGIIANEPHKDTYTLIDFINFYNEEKSNSIKSSTKQSNYYISNFFSPIFEKNIEDITTKEIKKILDEKLNSGLKCSYINKGLEYINKIYNFGIKQGIISTNPAKPIERYKAPDEQVKEMAYYTPDQFKLFISYFPKNKNGTLDYMCYVIVNCLYFLGLRINECLALSRSDINLKNKTVRINKTVFRNVNHQSYIITKPKTANSIRTILIPDCLISILLEYFQWYDSLYDITSSRFLFGVDTPIHPKNVRKRVKKAAKQANLPIIRLHDFRHSHASLLANSGLPINAIAARMGHTISECQKTYIHLFMDSEKRLINCINEQFPKK